MRSCSRGKVACVLETLRGYVGFELQPRSHDGCFFWEILCRDSRFLFFGGVCSETTVLLVFPTGMGSKHSFVREMDMILIPCRSLVLIHALLLVHQSEAGHHFVFDVPIASNPDPRSCLDSKGQVWHAKCAVHATRGVHVSVGEKGWRHTCAKATGPLTDNSEQLSKEIWRRYRCHEFKYIKALIGPDQTSRRWKYRQALAIPSQKFRCYQAGNPLVRGRRGCQGDICFPMARPLLWCLLYLLHQSCAWKFA